MHRNAPGPTVSSTNIMFLGYGTLVGINTKGSEVDTSTKLERDLETDANEK